MKRTRVSNIKRRFVVSTIAMFWIAVIPETAWTGVRQWKVGGDALSWKSQELASAAVDFNTPGAIQIFGFKSRDNIAQRLVWKDGIPPDFVTERAEAHIWDNLTLKRSDLPIVDGEDTTSTGDRFKTFGTSQRGTKFSFDLGARFPMSRIVFFPRQSGRDKQGRAYKDDFIRGYEVIINDGRSFNQENPPRPIYALASRVDFTRESLVEILFPLQFVRHIELNVLSANPFEIAEFQIFGTGFAPTGKYISKVINFGEEANFSRLEWTVEKLRQEGDDLVVEPEADAGISVQMHTGADDTPLVYHEITNLFLNEQVEVSEAEYNKLAEGVRGPIKEDSANWSPWSAPFTASGQRIDLPSPRRYFQFEINMESRAILDGVRVTSLSVEHFIPPLARQVVGEVSLLEDPRPPGNVPVVPAGVFSTFAYDVLADVRETDSGFDALRIFTPGSQPKLTEFLIGDPPVAVVPDSIEAVAGSLTVFFPSNRVTSRATGTLRAIFEAQVFVQGTFFNAEVFDIGAGESPQVVLAGDARPEVFTDRLQVLTSAEYARDLLPFFEVVPRAFSPNGDGINDQANVSYTLVQLVLPVEVEVEIFDLAGRRVRSLFSDKEGSGAYTWTWNGRDDSSKLLPVGIYLVAVRVGAGQESFVRTGTIGVVY